MSEILEKVESQIEIDKELIKVLPKKGIKNIRTLEKTLDETIEKYEDFKQGINREIKKRYENLNSVEANKEIEEIKKQIEDTDKIINICEEKTSFQKMGLDKLTWNINGFYKKELPQVNKDIKACLEAFNSVGIELTSKDFSISEYAQKYMKVLIEEIQHGNINSKKVQDTFEKVYWECSDVLLHISVNIRNIYNERENEIDKYYKNKAEEIFKKSERTAEEILEIQKAFIRRKNQIESVDKRVILDKFFNKTYAIGDYQEKEYIDTYENVIGRKISELSQEEKDKMDENASKLYSNLKEYSQYLKFKFIIKQIMDIRKKKLQEKAKEEENNKKAKSPSKDNKNQKEKVKPINYANEIKDLKKDITKLNSKISMSNKFKIVRKKQLQESKVERNKKILRLKDLYIKYDQDVIEEEAINEIDETSKILDVFRETSYHYQFLTSCIIKEFPEIVEEDIHKMIGELKEFIRKTDISVINNIEIESGKDISIIIKDRYKLSGMVLSKENFEDRNIEDLIEKVKKINNYNNIIKSGLNTEDIKFLLDAKEILL